MTSKDASVKERKKSHEKVVVKSLCLATGQGFYHAFAMSIIVLSTLVSVILCMVHGFSNFLGDIPMIMALGACALASLAATSSFLRCIFIGKKRTAIYLAFLILSMLATAGAGTFGFISVKTVDDRLDLIWDSWSTEYQEKFGEKYSCCGLREVAEDCPSSVTFSCDKIMTPYLRLADQSYSTLLFIIAGFQLMSFILIVWTTKMFHKKKHQLRDDLEAAMEPRVGLRTVDDVKDRYAQDKAVRDHPPTEAEIIYAEKKEQDRRQAEQELEDKDSKKKNKKKK